MSEKIIIIMIIIIDIWKDMGYNRTMKQTKGAICYVLREKSYR